MNSFKSALAALLLASFSISAHAAVPSKIACSITQLVTSSGPEEQTIVFNQTGVDVARSQIQFSRATTQVVQFRDGVDVTIKAGGFFSTDLMATHLLEAELKIGSANAKAVYLGKGNQDLADELITQTKVDGKNYIALCQFQE